MSHMGPSLPSDHKQPRETMYKLEGTNPDNPSKYGNQVMRHPRFAHLSMNLRETKDEVGATRHPSRSCSVLVAYWPDLRALSERASGKRRNRADSLKIGGTCGGAFYLRKNIQFVLQ